MSLQLEVGQKIYDFLKEKIPNLPEYRFNINNIKNSAIILLAVNPNIKYYFGNVRNFSFQLYNVNAVGDSLMSTQLKQNEKIIDCLRKDFKNIIINEKKYEIVSIMLNGSQQPLVDWISATLDGYDQTSQIYLLNLDIQIMEVQNG